jgi:hypothetical protein
LAKLVPWLEQRRVLAVPGADGRLALQLASGEATLDLALPAGRWHAEFAPADAAASLAIDDVVVDASGAFLVLHDGRHTLRLRAAADAATNRPITRIVLRRAGN